MERYKWYPKGKHTSLRSSFDTAHTHTSIARRQNLLRSKLPVWRTAFSIFNGNLKNSLSPFAYERDSNLKAWKPSAIDQVEAS